MSNLVEKMDLAEQVGRLYLQGKDATTISRELSIQRRQVTQALEDFRGLLRRNSESAVDVRDRLMDIIFESDESFRMVIDEAWETSKEAALNGQLGTKVQALKLVESATKNRADMLQKSGVSQDDEIISQLNEAEERQEVLIRLLKEIRDKHPEVAELIARRLSEIQQEVEVIVEHEGSDKPAIGGGENT